MAQDEVVIKYRIDTSEFGKVGAAVTDVSKKVDDLKVKAQAAFASGQLDAATNKLIQQGDVMGALIERYGSATAALKGLEKEMQTMAALGQRNTKEFKELARVTAELKDSVQDTRGEIKKMASDTRVFDTMVQGARGVAAAFSVATGVAAAFGDENKDLQKTLLKVQGAMAALQGVQELANLATEKGGIASKAYAAALQVVDRISKVTGLSMAASWALATGGITLAIAAIGYFISSTDDAEESSSELNKTLSDQKNELAKLEVEYANASGKIDDYTKSLMLLEIERKKQLTEISSDAEKKALEKTGSLLYSAISVFSPALAASLQAKNYAKNWKEEMDKRGNEIDNINKIFDEKRAIERAKNQKEIAKKAGEDLGKLMKQQIEAMREADRAVIQTLDIKQEFREYIKNAKQGVDEPLITEETVDQNKANADKMAKDLADAYNKAKADRKVYEDTKRQLESDYWTKSFELASKTMSTINELVVSSFNNQMQALDSKRNEDLKRAGDNSKRKEVIEKKYAIESAKIARKVAIANKVSSLFQIAIDLAQAINKINLQAAILRANPATAALAGLAQSQIGFAIATAGLSTIAVAAKPLPTIPQFEKGGRVLAGGRKDDGMLFGRSHRDGGILIEAQGGEYIWDIPTVKKHGDVIKAAHENRLEQHVFHKYVVPQMQKGRAAQGHNESYDDFMLRTTVKNSGKDTADRIVNGLAKVLKKDSYLISRYG